jgi:hypothetical protein
VKLSADRNCILGLDRDSVRVFDALTLKPLGDTALAKAPTGGKLDPRAFAINHAGTEIAGVFQVQGLPNQNLLWSVQTWDAKTGKWLAGFEFQNSVITTPNVEVGLQYAGLNLLFDHRLLIDLETKAPIWAYSSNFVESRVLSQQVDDRLWYAAAPIFNQPAVLHAITLPEAEALRYVKIFAGKPDSVFPWKSRVGVTVTMPEDRQGKGKDKALLAAGSALTRAGHSRDASAGAQLQLNFQEKDLREKTQYRMFGRLGTVDVQLYEVECTATLVYEGQTVWSSGPEKVGMRQLFVSIPQDVTDLSAYLRDQMWENAANWPGRLNLPRQVIRGPGGLLALPGQSQLKATGIVTAPPLAVRGNSGVNQ